MLLLIKESNWLFVFMSVFFLGTFISDQNLKVTSGFSCRNAFDVFRGVGIEINVYDIPILLKTLSQTEKLYKFRNNRRATIPLLPLTRCWVFKSNLLYGER